VIACDIINPDSMALSASAASTGRESRAEKVRRIFERFDTNGNGGLDRNEMAALVVAVNPRVKFSEDQISAILDEVFRTYAEFILPDGCAHGSCAGGCAGKEVGAAVRGAATVAGVGSDGGDGCNRTVRIQAGARLCLVYTIVLRISRDTVLIPYEILTIY
jgi:hypothetical protein